MTNDLPTISVITPSYNQAAFVRQTVESVLSQGYDGLDYIVVDGLSTDGSLAILREYVHADQLTLIAEADRGQTDALNKGLRRATGEIVCWLNSDDYFLPGTLQTVARYFAKHPNALWLTADCLIVNTAGQPIQGPIRYYKRLLRSLGSRASLGLTNAICQPATFWRRSVHDQIGYLDNSLRYTMDYDFWLRMNQLQSPSQLNKPLTAFRIHAHSKGGSQFEVQFAEDFLTFCRYNPPGWLAKLHLWHNRAIVGAYRLLK
jgi:glycosyltransferase involved in cell wall biosynthesis